MSVGGEKETARIEAFSDGVFAIAITLLILEIQVPQLPPGASSLHLFRALLRLWPSFLAYLGSFTAILIMWVNHHGFFKLVERANARLQYANGFLLLLITFVPFPTSVLAAYLNRQGTNMAAAFYCGTFVFVNIGYNLLWFSAAAPQRLFKTSVSENELLRIRNAYLLTFPIYLGAAIISFYFAYIGLLICSSLWILWAMLRYAPQER